ncbi:MAG: aspartate carbamoyltransferase catalytic subunit [Parvularculaceae bacterium]
MTIQPTCPGAIAPTLRPRRLISVGDLDREDVAALFAMAEDYAALNASVVKKCDRLKGRTQINLFFEKSTRTQMSFELAGKRLGADVVNFSVASSSVSKGESLADTVLTLNAMGPDLIVVRHSAAGAPELIADLADCAIVNAGDGMREHPTQALLDAFTIQQSFGGVEGLVIAICGDILHSRVARSNINLLQMLGAQVRLVGPPSLLPAAADRLTPFVYTDLAQGLDGADVVMALRLQTERMTGGFIPSLRDYHAQYGITEKAMAAAKPDAKVLHPGPMNRGVEIEARIADDPERCLVLDQVAAGVAIRMAVLDALAHGQSGPADG